MPAMRWSYGLEELIEKSSRKLLESANEGMRIRLGTRLAGHIVI